MLGDYFRVYPFDQSLGLQVLALEVFEKGQFVLVLGLCPVPLLCIGSVFAVDLLLQLELLCLQGSEFILKMGRRVLSGLCVGPAVFGRVELVELVDLGEQDRKLPLFCLDVSLELADPLLL